MSPHGDYDHLGEALKIIDNFKIEKVFINEGYINNNKEKIINRIDSNVLYEGSFFGEKNKYGHPNKEVLDNLKNSKIYTKMGVLCLRLRIIN